MNIGKHCQTTSSEAEIDYIYSGRARTNTKGWPIYLVKTNICRDKEYLVTNRKIVNPINSKIGQDAYGQLI
jgi:hypothetical protein